MIGAELPRVENLERHWMKIERAKTKFARNSSMTCGIRDSPLTLISPCIGTRWWPSTSLMVCVALLLQFAEKRGGIALPLVQPFRAIDKTNRLFIALHRRPISQEIGLPGIAEL